MLSISKVGEIDWERKIFDDDCLAIRSGDYYMFEYESDQEEDEEKQDEATRAQEEVERLVFLMKSKS